MRLSRDAALGTVIIYLSKAPRLEEIVGNLVKGIPIEYSYFLSDRTLRTGFTKLLLAKSISEVDKYIFEVYKEEFEYMKNVLPEEYAHYFYTFLEIFDIEKLLATESTTKEGTEAQLYTGILDSPHYEECRKASSYRCFMNVYIDRIRSSANRIYRSFMEPCINALNAIAIFVSIRYFMYLKNSHILALAEYKYGEFLKYLNQQLRDLTPVTMQKLYMALENIERDIEKSLDELWIHEITYIYDIIKNLLYYSYQLVDQLTLYLINRYYEQRVMRYLHPLMTSVRSKYRSR